MERIVKYCWAVRFIKMFFILLYIKLTSVALFEMAKTINLNQLLAEVKLLDDAAKLNLVERIIALIKTEQKPKAKISITDLNGLGKEIWKNVDVNKYIDNKKQFIELITNN